MTTRSILCLTHLACLAVVPVPFTACSTDLTVPQEAQLGCQSSADCPSGWTCNEKVGRCVKTENIDSDAPALVGDVTVTTSVLKNGAVTTVSFSVSEELSVPPVVTVDAGTDRVLTLDEKLSAAAVGSAGAPGAESDRATRYVFTYLAAGDEPQGVESPISIVLTDKSGNESGKLSGGLLKFDFISPSIPADKVFVTGSPAKKDGVVTVKFSVSEPLSAAPVVSLALSPYPVPLVPDASSTGLDYVFTYSATGNEPEDAAGVGVTVDIEDEATNAASVVLEKPVMFDFTKPKLKSTPVVTPVVAKEASLITVTFEADEELGADPVVTLGTMELSKGSGVGTTFTYTHIAAAADGEGEKALSITIEDRAGNKAEGIPGGSLTFDFAAPAISNPAVDPPKAKSNVPVTVTFTASEALKTDPVVKAGSIVFSKVGEPRSPWPRWGQGQVLPSPAPLPTSPRPSPSRGEGDQRKRWFAGEGQGEGTTTYIYSYTLTGSEEQTGLSVTVDLTDEAGNAATGLVAGSFVPDFVNPSIAGTPVVNKAFAKSGDEVTVAFSVSEAQKTDPAVSAGGIVFGKKSQTANDYVFVYTLKGTEAQGATSVSIELLDKAENAAAGLPGGNFTIDFDAPALLGTAVATPAVAKKGQLITLDFDTNEELGTDPVVMLAGKAMNRQAQSGTHYTYSAMAAESDGEGTKGTAVQLVDKAGNGSGSISGPSIVFDFSVPAATVTELKAGPYRSPKTGEGDVEVHAKFTTGENLDPAAGQVKVRIGDKWAAACVDGAGTTFDCVFKVPADLQPDDDLEGVKAVILDITDGAGNAAIVSAGTVTFDFTAPVLSLKVDPAGRPARLGETVTIGVSSTEPLDETGVSLESGTLLLNAPSVSGTTYTWTYTAKDTDNASFTLSATAKDAAGNAATAAATGSVALDGVVPTAGSANVTPDRVKGSEKFEVTFSSSEALPADPEAVFSNGTDAPVSMALKTKTGNDYVYEATAPQSSSSPYYNVTVTLADAAGNERSTSAGTIEIDNVAPQLAGPLDVSPAAAKLDVTVRVVLTADETLANAPSLSASNGTDTITFAKVDDVPGKIGYAYTYSVTGTSPPGVFTVQPFSMSDVAGNTRSGVTPSPPAVFSVDSTKPAVTNVATDKARYSRQSGNDRVTVTFDCTENVGSGLAVKVGGETMTCDAYSATSPSYTCRYDVQSGDTAGIKSINIQAQDAAGNADFESMSVEYDFAGPVLTTSSASPSPAGLGKTLVYSLNASEPLLSDPVLHPTPAIDFGSPAHSGSLYSWTRTITGAETQGAYTMTVDLTDVVGNTTTGAAAAGFGIDAVLPAIATGPTLNKNPAYYKVGDTVTVTFSTNEDLDATLPTATLNTTTPVNMPCVAGGGSNDYTCSLGRNLASSDVPEGQVSVSIALKDAAQNTGSGNATLTLDYTNPSLVSATPSQAYYRGGQTIAYTASVSEPLSGSPGRPTLRVYKDSSEQVGYFIAPSSETATSFTYTKAVTADGVYTVQVDLTDIAGNAVANTGSPAGWTIDATLMTVTPESVLTNNPNTALAKLGNEVTATFATSEDPPANPSVTLGGDAMAFDSKSGSGPWTFVYKRTTLVGDTDGLKTASVTATDAAGNVTVQDVGSVTYDFASPTFSSSAAPSPAGLSKVLTYSLNASEALLNNPALDVNPPLALSGPAQSGTLYTWTRTIDGSEAQGAYTVTADLTDLAGNQTTGAAAAGFSIDAVLPAIATGPTLNKNPTHYKVGDTVTVTFSTNEDLDATLPTATLNTTTPVNMPCVAGAGLNDYTCSLGRNLAATDLPQGQVSVSIALKDAAQNTGFGSATLTLDYTNPSLVSAAPSQAYYRAGQTIAYTASVSEPLSGSPGRPAVRVYKDTIGQAGYFGNPSSETETSFTYTKAVTADGTYAVQVDLTDKAGNAVTNTGSPVGWSIDATAPAVTVLNPSEGARFSREAGYNTLAVQFDTGGESFDAVPGGLSVTAGGVDITAGCGSFSAASPNYTCTHTVGAGDTEGLKTVAVTAKDNAGNQTGTGTSVFYDFTPPGVNGVAFVSLTPPVGCPLGAQALQTITNGTTVQVQFPVSELVKDGEADSVKAILGAQELVFDYSDRDSSDYVKVYISAVSGATLEGEHTLTVGLTDVVGNTQVVIPTVSPGIELDLSQPAAPDVNTPDRVVYSRIPWGSDATGGIKTFSVTGGADSVTTDAAWVLAYDGPDPATAAEIGRKAAAGGTFGTMELNRADRTEVHVAAYDRACNRSPVVRVRDSEWIATMGYKVPGSTVENPHVFRAAPHFLTTLSQEQGMNIELTSTDLPKVQRSGDGHAMPRTAEANWQEVVSNGLKPSARGQNAMAYDAARGVVVMFGGYSDGFRNDTWEWSGMTGTWTDRTPVGNKPTVRYGATMAYDAGRGKVVLFGGRGSNLAFLNDTWEWDGATGTWFERTPGAGNPPGRYDHAMAYDSERAKTVVFGGYGGGGELRDTWEWDGRLGTWTQYSTDPSLVKRNGCRMAYDAENKKMVMYGGYDGGSFRTDTWSYGLWGMPTCSTATTPCWKDVSPPTNPGVKDGPGMTYDPERRKVVLFGGKEGPVILYDTTWEWGTWGTPTCVSDTVQCWKDVTPAGTKPAARALTGIAYDAQREEVVVFGGGFDDTWEWNGSRWLDRTPSTVKPSRRAVHAMAYDSDRGVAVLFGGKDDGKTCTGGVSIRCNDTWEFDEGTAKWRSLTPVAAPPGRSHHAMAYDPTRTRMVVFGGLLDGDVLTDETWEYDGTTWDKRCDNVPPGDNCGTLPPVRGRATLAYSGGGKMLMFGGWGASGEVGDTWEYNGTTWTNLNPSPSPSAREKHDMAYDPDRNVVVLFGGSTGGNQTWEWNGSAWDRRCDGVPEGDTCSVTPIAGAGKMAYDTSRKTIVWLKDTATSEYVYEWNGTNWAGPFEPRARPSSRWDAALAPLPSRGTVMTFGGYNGQNQYNDTWEWNGGSTERPGESFEAAFVDAAVPAAATLQSVTASIHAGGVGYPGGVTTNGADLMVWDEGRWKWIDQNTSGTTLPFEELTWTTTDPIVMSRLFVGDWKTLNFAVAPTQPNGWGLDQSHPYGEVSVDYSEVTVRYRLP